MLTMHRYTYDTDLQGGSAAARVVRQVGWGKRVLELGTGPGSITRILQQQDCKITGLEIDAQAAELCRPFCERMECCDLESAEWCKLLQGERFDVIVAADVLEHLRDPAQLLQRLPEFLQPEGYLVVSLPNASHLSLVACLVAGRFPYQNKGLLDSSHLRFFGRADIEALLQNCGLLWQRWEAARLEPVHAELQSYWQQLSEEERKFLAGRVVDGEVYQHVIKAYPTTAAGHVAKARADLLECEEKFKLSEAARQRQLAEIEVLELERKHLTATVQQNADTLRDLELERERQAAVVHLQEADLERLSEALRMEAYERQRQADLAQALQAQVTQHTEHIRGLELAQADMHQSHSWRITAPLRFLAEVFRAKPPGR